MPPAARITDNHVCPIPDHVGGPLVQGAPTVIVGFQPQSRVGDALICLEGEDKVAKGSPTVIVEGRQAARLTDPTVHGGVIVTGFPTVIIGETGQIAVMRAAAAAGIPFCEECAKDALASACGAV